VSGRLLTLEQAAQRAAVQESTILDWVNRKWLATYPGGLLRYRDVLFASQIQLETYGVMESPTRPR
jgi:DNA-directed RNA polymerase specialized sigma54-like protein